MENLKRKSGPGKQIVSHLAPPNTVSAVPATEEQAGPSGVAASGDGAAGRGRGTASKKAKTEAWRVNANLYVSSDEDDSDYYDNMGADSDDN